MPVSAAPGTVGTDAPVFRSWFMGGFEGSTMRLDTGRRVDAVAQSRHDLHADGDYRLIAACGLRTAREALRWPLIAAAPGRADWSSALRMARAATRAGVEVIWDLCHFDIPEHLDPWSADLPERFADYAAAAARVIGAETDGAPTWCPVNEISYWAFAGGERGHIFPFGVGRGAEWKQQLARMAIAGTRAVKAVDAHARVVHADPVIHIVPSGPAERDDAAWHRGLMFDAWDMIAGRGDVDVGGTPGCLDVVGVNFYSNNQWFHHGRTILRGDPGYRPLRAILDEVWQRYGRPIVITETGAEGARGPAWLGAIAAELRSALDAGIPIAGCCLYPVMDYPGWVDDRHCRCGPISVEPGWGRRRLDPAMCEALAAARSLIGVDAPAASSEPAPRRRSA